MAHRMRRDKPMEPRDRNFTALMLIVVGLLLLLVNGSQSATWAMLVLPGLGIIFLIWGFYTRRFGLTIPGCILTGLGIPLILTQQGIINLEGEKTGALFVLGLGLGFLAMTFIAPYFERKLVWWPLIPGGILALIGVLIFIGGDALQVLAWLGTLWPLFLVAIGLYILFWPGLRRE